MDRWKNKESNYCQDRDIRPLVAALGRGERRRKDSSESQIARKTQRDTKLNLITSSTEHLLLKNTADETGFKTFNGKARPKCNCSSQLLLGSG